MWLCFILFITLAYGREYYIDPSVWLARHQEMCAFVTGSLEGGGVQSPLCMKPIYTDDWSQLSYARMRSWLSAKFRVDFHTMREIRSENANLELRSNLFCIYGDNLYEVPSLLKC